MLILATKPGKDDLGQLISTRKPGKDELGPMFTFLKTKYLKQKV